MKNTFRIATPGVNAFTNSDPNKYALHVDPDRPENILIKELKRGTITLASTAQKEIAHGLGYVPLFYVFVNITGDEWAFVGIGNPISTQYYAIADKYNLTILNNDSNSHEFKFFIFHDFQL